MGTHHPKKLKEFKSPESYRKFRAYVHMRTPSGKMAAPSKSISALTPPRYKEPRIKIGGKLHKVKLTKKK